MVALPPQVGSSQSLASNFRKEEASAPDWPLNSGRHLWHSGAQGAPLLHSTWGWAGRENIQHLSKKVQVLITLPSPCTAPLVNFIFVFAFLFIFWPHPAARRILVAQPGIEPTSPAFTAGVLTTGPPRKSPFASFILSRKQRGHVFWSPFLCSA